jgi:hypothetical protein
MIFRLSHKLNTKIKAEVLSALPLNENPFADWSAHLFVADQTQHIILSNTRSFYSTLLYAKGITNGNRFIECALRSIREFMIADGQEAIYRKHVAPASASVRFAKALDRSVTGSMNDLISHAKLWLAEGDVSPHDVGCRLNDVLLSVLGRSTSVPYGKPREVFQQMLDQS